MSVFDAYGRFYDLLYKEKDYAGEARFVHNQLLKVVGRPGRLLELGCGTGRHAVELARLGWTVDGVDQSDTMIGRARKRADDQPLEVKARLHFLMGDIRSVETGSTYDAVISMFHVMSYQTKNEDLQMACGTAAKHLRHGCPFLFDFWYGPAVLRDPPVVRVKRIEDEKIAVTRLAEPELKTELNQVVVNYEVFMRDKELNTTEQVTESHAMRYLFLPEMIGMLRDANMNCVDAGAWGREGPLGPNTWYGWLAAVRA